MIVKVRVRGIYATALSVILHSRGFLLADVSEVLQRRLNIPVSEGAPDVTVKSVEGDPDYLLVIGYPWEAGVEVARVLEEEIPHAIVREGRLGLYTVVDLDVDGECRGSVEGVEVRVEECRGPGRVRASIVREALEEGSTPIARPGVRLVGRYTIASVPGEGVSFSEHIRDPERRADLLAEAASAVDTSRVHIHFRSSSRSAPLDEVAREAADLAEKALSLAGEEPGEPGVVARGEYIALIGVPRTGKERLDEARARVVPTIRGHHVLKSFGDFESSLVDCAEEAVGLGASLEGSHIEYHVAKKSVGRRFWIDHHKPSGGRIRLGPFTLESIAPGDPPTLTLTRTFTRPGVLDALGVVKEPGDRGVTRLRPGDWYVVHEYLDKSGRLLGVYANVNTPVEVGHGRAKYFDLYIDVVKKPGEEPRIVDREQLEEARRQGLVSGELYEKALEVAEYLARRLASTYP